MSADELLEENTRLKEAVARLAGENARLKWWLSEANRKLAGRPPAQGRTEEEAIKHHEFVTLVMERDRHTCQDCGQVGGSLLVHHIRLQKYHPHLRYDVGNGVTLCGPCHDKRHSGLNHWRRKDADLNAPI